MTPDIHLLAGQLVAGDLDLALGGDRVFGVRIFANDLFESLHRLLGALLVTRDFRHLIEIGRADEELRIGGVRASRMQRDVAARRADAVLVGIPFVIGESRHDQRFARPFRIRVLAIDLFELLGRALSIFLGIQKIKTFIVELIGGLLRSNGVFVKHAAGAKCHRYDQQGSKARRRARATLQPFNCQ